MTETTEEYRNRINQLKTNIENEPYIQKMRENIAEGIYKTGNRQADIEDQFQEVIDNTTGKDVIAAPELIAARNGKPNLKTRIDDLENETNAQLAQTAHYISARTFPGNSGGEKIQNALDSDFPHVSAHKVVVVDSVGPDENGEWLLTSQLQIPSNTTLLLNGSYLKLAAQANQSAITNSDYENGNANVNIEGHGAVVDCNRAGQLLSLNNYQNIGLHLYNVDGFSIKGIKLKDASRWSLVPEKCTNGVIDDIYFDNEGHVNQDGVHIIGPSSDIIATKIRGTLGDDACVVNARLAGAGSGVFQGYGTGGDVRRVTFSDVIISGGTRGAGAHTGILRTSGSPTTVIEDIILNNAIGYNLKDGMLRLGGNDAIPLENHRNITANNIIGYEGESGSISLVNLLRPVKNLQISNAKIIGGNRTIISCNTQDIDGLQMTNIYRKVTSDQMVYSHFGWGNATVKNVHISNLHIERENPEIEDKTLIENELSTLDNVVIENVTAPSVLLYFTEWKISETTILNTRLNNVYTHPRESDNWNIDPEQEVVVNGYSVERNASEQPIGHYYQSGDFVKHVNTELSITSLFMKDNRGEWLKILTE